MLLSSFRQEHILQILNQYSAQEKRLDIFLRNYFRDNTSIGSKDRTMIAEIIYGIIRWRDLLDHLSESTNSWEQRLHAYLSFNPEEISELEDIPSHIQVSFPEHLFTIFEDAYGTEEALAICRVSNERAPTTIRVNTLKVSRDELMKIWKDKYEVTPCKYSSDGLIFRKRENFFNIPEFKLGYFEIQDEGSQMIAHRVHCKPGDHVLDYCAGSGGKALGIAPKMQNKGQLYLHDIRSYVLEKARQRLRRAGIQNIQVLLPEHPQLFRMKSKMDWVLVDAPCSGTGTIRRNPDMKWHFSIDAFEKILISQKEIFAEALQYLKPGGTIVYATCSILPQENEQQIEEFIKEFGLRRTEEDLKILPRSGEADGFFAASLTKIA